MWFIVIITVSLRPSSTPFLPTHIQCVKGKGGAPSVLTSVHVVWATAVTPKLESAYVTHAGLVLTVKIVSHGQWYTHGT